MIFDLGFFLPLLAFSVVSSITPGPNVLMIMASSTNYGYARTLPHIFGVALGFPLMMLALGLGLSGIFASHLWVYDALKWLCLPVLLWMAWRIATAGVPQGAEIKSRSRSQRPLRMHEAMLFQWVNAQGLADRGERDLPLHQHRIPPLAASARHLHLLRPCRPALQFHLGGFWHRHPQIAALAARPPYRQWHFGRPLAGFHVAGTADELKYPRKNSPKSDYNEGQAASLG